MTTQTTLEEKVRKYFEIMDDARLFDGDKRGHYSTLQDKENEIRKLVGVQEIDNDG